MYGKETLPLPARSDPRRRRAGAVLGLTASALFGVSIPLTVLLLADRLGVTVSQVLRITGLSVIATLWIFQGIALAVVALYSSILVLRKKAEAGAAWVVFGIVAITLDTLFFWLAGLTGALVAVAAGGLVLAAGLLDVL